jgi:hypothetical protein
MSEFDLLLQQAFLADWVITASSYARTLIKTLIFLSFYQGHDLGDLNDTKTSRGFLAWHAPPSREPSEWVKIAVQAGLMCVL